MTTSPLPPATHMSAALLKGALLSQLAYDHVGSPNAVLAKALQPLGCELLDKVYDQKTDTHAFACIDHCPPIPGTSDRLARVVFRGTASLKNVVTDLDALKTDWPAAWYPLPVGYGPWVLPQAFHPRVHKGMTEALQAVHDKLMAALAPYLAVLDLETNGHSLGASEAEGFAARLAAKTVGAKPRVTSVNFGSPRYGDDDWARMYGALIPYSLRVVHDMDIIPTVPADLDPKKPDWEHVGQELRILDNGKVAWPVGSWWRHLWAALTGRAEGDHPIARYVAAIRRMA